MLSLFSFVRIISVKFFWISSPTMTEWISNNGACTEVSDFAGSPNNSLGHRLIVQLYSVLSTYANLFNMWKTYSKWIMWTCLCCSVKHGFGLLHNSQYFVLNSAASSSWINYLFLPIVCFPLFLSPQGSRANSSC